MSSWRATRARRAILYVRRPISRLMTVANNAQPMYLTAITFGALAVGMIVAFVATAPDFPVTALTIGFVIGAIVIPVLAFPFTNLLWMAVDLFAHKPDEQELIDAGIAVAEQQFLAEDA